MGHWRTLEEARPYMKMDKIRKIYETEGTARAVRYVRKIHRVKINGAQLRELLGVPKQDIRKAQYAHRLAWSLCGWKSGKRYV